MLLYFLLMLVFIPTRVCVCVLFFFFCFFLELGFSSIFWSLSLIGSTFNFVAGTCCTNVFVDFKAYLDSLNHEFSVIGLSETWLNQNNMNDFQLSGYSNTGMTRIDKQVGGVALNVNNSFQFGERADLAINVRDVIEYQFVELTSKPNSTIIGIIYRPLSDKLDLFKECLAELLQKIDLLNKECYLMRDFNLDFLKIDGKQHIKDFINQMFSSIFYPLISRPTRITNSTATIMTYLT